MRRIFVGLLALLAFSTSLTHNLTDKMSEVLPSVVYLYVDTFVKSDKIDPITKLTTRTKIPSQPIIGTGFVIDGNNVVTNYHVIAFAIKNNTDVYVTFKGNNRHLKTKILGYDKIADIALLEIPGEHPSVKIVDCSDLRMGDAIFSISHFYGIGWSGTEGIVSSNTRRDVRYPYINNLQLQLLQGSGSSGGPVFNRDGDVIALNHSIVSMFPREAVAKGRSSSMLSMVGYPIRGDTIIKSIEAIRKDIIVTYLDFGVTLIAFGKNSPFHLNRDDDDDTDYPVGIMVLKIDKNLTTPLQPTDIIISIDGKKFSDPLNLFEWLNNQDKYKAGKVVSIEVYRDAEIINIAIPITIAGL